MPPIEWPFVCGFVVFVAGLWLLAGVLKRSHGLSDGDARKLNHIGTLVVGATVFVALPDESARWSARIAAGTLFGMLLLACNLPTWPICRTVVTGYARQRDRPHEVFHVWFSWFVSVAGLLLIDAIYHDIWLAATAAMILGIADGVAEPVGTRWGRHRLVLCWPGGTVAAVRSWEGSAAACMGAILVTAAALLAAGATNSVLVMTASLFVGISVTAVEAVTPHGWDNFTIPVAAAALLEPVRTWLV